MHSHHNGLKTAVLFAGIWAVLLGLGWAAAAYFRSSALILVFALLGLVTTFALTGVLVVVAVALMALLARETTGEKLT